MQSARIQNPTLADYQRLSDGGRQLDRLRMNSKGELYVTKGPGRGLKNALFGTVDKRKVAAFRKLALLVANNPRLYALVSSQVPASESLLQQWNDLGATFRTAQAGDFSSLFEHDAVVDEINMAKFNEMRGDVLSRLPKGVHIDPKGHVNSKVVLDPAAGTVKRGLSSAMEAVGERQLEKQAQGGRDLCPAFYADVYRVPMHLCGQDSTQGKQGENIDENDPRGADKLLNAAGGDLNTARVLSSVLSQEVTNRVFDEMVDRSGRMFKGVNKVDGNGEAIHVDPATHQARRWEPPALGEAKFTVVRREDGNFELSLDLPYYFKQIKDPADMFKKHPIGPTGQEALLMHVKATFIIDGAKARDGVLSIEQEGEATADFKGLLVIPVENGGAKA